MSIFGSGFRTAILAGAALGVPLYAQAVPATTPSDASPAASAQTGGLQEIVVTAQKRAENLQKVPISVTAIGGNAVKQSQIPTLQGLYGKVPNVQLNNFSNTPNSAVITIRGIGVIEPDPYAGNTVSIVVDGVPQYFSMGALVELFDIDRIEVLRGPQGTLFGANTTGGVVNITTNQPTGRFGGFVEGTYGNYHRFDIRGSVDVPIIKNILAGKFGISHTQRDGFVTNVVDGSDMGSRDVTIYRGALKLTPSSQFDATLSGEYTRARNGAPIVVSGAYPGEALYVAPGPVAGSELPMYQSVCSSSSTPCRASGKYYSARNTSDPDISNLDAYRTTLTMNLRDTPIGDITSVTGYRHFHLLEYTDDDASPLDLFDARRDTKGYQFSQEVRTAAKLSDAINIIGGAFYMKTHYTHDQGNKLLFSAPGLLNVNLQDQHNYSVSGFVQGYAQVTDRLRLQAGIRYSHEQTSMLASAITTISPTGVTNYQGSGNTLLVSVAPPEASKSWNNVGWKLGVDYELFDRTMLYGYWARGFKSGGFVGRIGIPQDIGPYSPEKVDTFEGGIKSDLLNHRLRVNLSAFYTNYRDMQLAQIYFTYANGIPLQGNTILNAAKSNIKGFEFETSAVPLDGLTLNGSLAYLDAKYKNFPYTDPLTISAQNPLGVPENLKGSRLQNSPKWSATTSINYDLKFGEKSKATFNLSYSYVGQKYFTAIVNTNRTSIRPTNLVDANVTVFPWDDRVSVGFWGRNLFNKHYLTSCYDSPGLQGFCGFGPPREYGATVRYNF